MNNRHLIQVSGIFGEISEAETYISALISGGWATHSSKSPGGVFRIGRRIGFVSASRTEIDCFRQWLKSVRAASIEEK